MYLALLTDMTTDLIIVGSGILGLATAFKSHQQGLSVTVIDRSERPVGSSIMNFGHACFTGQSDADLDIAWASRAGWKEAAEATGLWAHESGTYVPAVADTEMKILEEFAAHRGSEQVQLLEADQVAAGIGNTELTCLGGAFLPLDMRVNPREAAPRLAQWLQAKGVEFHWRHEVKEVSDGTVLTNRGTFTAEHVIACPNYFLTQLFPEIADKYRLEVCTLDMALIERPQHIPENLALFTGTSLARYGGFSTLPSAAALKQDLAEREPELVNMVANLMVTGIPEGLLVGDNHAYDLSPEPFIHEDRAAVLLDKATSYLGVQSPMVKQRWQGRYANSTEIDLILEQVDPRTTVAVVASGIGMTMSFGIADVLLNNR